MADPAWQGGAYPPGEGPRKGLSVARMLAMITYRSEQVFVDRWMRSVARGNPLEWEGQFQVESYLHHQGESLVRRFDANCYLYLSRAMDLHDAGEGRSPEFLRSALAGKHLLAVGIGSDLLFPNWQVEELSRIAADRGAHATYEEIESDHGHDAFLIDIDQVDEMLRRFWRSSGL
jgi:homoserine O-acetyltransferase